ncbi:MAG: FHA domain-containing protein [Chloroflexota bacterium]|nr:FHA domain-containing protein [Chloroflexota bacterium]
MTESFGGSLHITSPGEPEWVFPIEEAVVDIGRAPGPDNDLVLEHGWVSRRHARIYCDRLPYRIQDLESSNGTSVNGTTLPSGELRSLRDGDVIAIGPFRLTFEAPEPVQEAEPEEVAGGTEGEEPGGLGARRAPGRYTPSPPRQPPTQGEIVPPSPERWVGMPVRESRWLQYLPPIYADDDFLGRFLLIFEDLIGPVEQTIRHFDLYLDPCTAPESFLAYLNDWLAEIVDERWPRGIQREFLRNAGWLYAARGTKPGLQRYLEICTGCASEIIENAEGPHTFHVVVKAEGKEIDRRMVERVIEVNCPAHVYYTLDIE